jgi:SAM-dependent methyltransferase
MTPNADSETLIVRPKSVVYGRDKDVIPHLLDIHAVAAPAILDACYSTGKMWKGLKYNVTSMDIDPAFRCDFTADFRAMPLSDDSFDVVAFDPPHLPNANATNDRTTGHADVYGVRVRDDARNADHVSGLFVPFLQQAARVLRCDGIVIAKIADLVHNHRYQWQHVDFINAARLVGLTPCDVVIKADPTAGNLSSSKWENVHHFRRAHLYWIVVRKGRCERGAMA